MVKKKQGNKRLVVIIIIAVILIYFLPSDPRLGETCMINEELQGNCKPGLLCNVGVGGFEGTCNTVDQCIASGSTADAFDGSDVCFAGV